MKKKAPKKAAAKKSHGAKSAKKLASRAAKPVAKAIKHAPKAIKARVAKPSRKAAVVPVPAETDTKLTFNHAMIYVKDVERSLRFYRDLMGFKLIEDFRYENQPVYARLRAPGGDGTIALHLAGSGVSIVSEGVRLYFEVGQLDDFCRKLQQKGFFITQLPRMMPWGWRHAYLNDPDGHEISLYWAGENRFKKSVMKVVRETAKN